MDTEYFVQPKHPEALFQQLPNTFDDCEQYVSYIAQLLRKANESKDDRMIEEIHRLGVHLRYRYIVLSGTNNDFESQMYKTYYEHFYPNLIFPRPTKRRTVATLTVLPPISSEPIPLPWFHSSAIGQGGVTAMPQPEVVVEEYADESLVDIPLYELEDLDLPAYPLSFARILDETPPLLTSLSPGDVNLIATSYVEATWNDLDRMDYPVSVTKYNATGHLITLKNDRSSMMCSSYTLSADSELNIRQSATLMHIRLIESGHNAKRLLTDLACIGVVNGMYDGRSTLFWFRSNRIKSLLDLSFEIWIRRFFRNPAQLEFDYSHYKPP